MLRPWEDPRADPDGLPANEVTLTAWIETQCDRVAAAGIKCDFQWFAADGSFGDLVEAGALTSWSSEDRESSKAPAAAEKVPSLKTPQPEQAVEAGAEEEAERQPPCILARFERKSGALKATCPFVRQLADLALRVRVSWQPADAPEGTEAKPLQAEVVLQLAQLLVLGGGGQPVCAAEDGLRLLAANEAIETFRIGVDSSGAICSEEIRAHLNPLVLTLDAAHKLPSEEGLGQTRDRAFGVLQAFGETRRTEIRGIDERGLARFRFHSAFFTGPWRQRELREYLQTQRVAVEVHDRDPRPPERKASKVVEEAAVSQDKKKMTPEELAKQAEEEAKSAAAAAAAEEAARAASRQSPHGIARMKLDGLLNPHLKHALVLRADLEPAQGCTKRERRENKAAGGGAGALRVSTVFGPGGRELVSSMEAQSYDFAPGYLQSGAYVTLSAAFAQPLRPPAEGYGPEASAAEAEHLALMATMVKTRRSPSKLSQRQSQMESMGARPSSNQREGAASPSPGRAPSRRPASESPDSPTPTKPVPRYERFARMVMVLDYKRTTVLKRLLNTIREVNAAALNLDEGEARALASWQLTEEQRNNPDLDILTGFLVMDRKARVIVIEGLRAGAMQKAADVVGVGREPVNRKAKVMYNPEVGFSHRLYLDFNLSLKQIKLRSQMLENLTQRPELCLTGGRSEQDAAACIHRLAEIKRAVRLHVLKAMDAFPTAQSLVTVETQYGDFVTKEELNGGCVVDDDTKSKAQSRVSRSEHGAGSRVSRRLTSTSGSKQLKDAPQEPQEESEGDEDGDSEPDLIEGPKTMPKVTLKADLDATNLVFIQSLKEREQMPPPDIHARNLTILKDRSERNAQETTRKVGPRKVVDTSFLEPGQTVHIYSGQKLNTADLQKDYLRKKNEGKEQTVLLTYSENRNSGCFPMLAKEVPLSKMLREEVPVDDGREIWKYPKPRDRSEYSKPDRDISDARKEELTSAWIENEFGQRCEYKEVISGAFDAKSLGVGGSHVIPTRRPGLQEPFAPEPAEPEAKMPPMRFYSRVPAAQEAPVDKYHKTLLDGEPECLGFCFEDRKVPRKLAKKYGPGAKAPNVEPPPVSISNLEPFVANPGNSEYLTDFMRRIARPTYLPDPAPSPRGPDKLGKNSVRLNLGKERTFEEPGSSTTLGKVKGSAQGSSTTMQTAPQVLSARGSFSSHAGLGKQISGMPGPRQLSSVAPQVPLSAR